SMADHHLANVFYSDGYAIIATDDNVPNIAGVAHQSNPAHIVKLPALGVESTARIGIIRGQRRHDLRNRQVVSIDPRRVEQYLVLHYGTAEAGVIGDSVNGAISTLHHPI